MLTYLCALKDDYIDNFKQHKNNWLPLPAQSLYTLVCIASIMLVVAGISYVIGGYHVAFLNINSLTAYIPPFILHNATVFGDGSLLLALILLFANRHTQFHWTVLIASLLGGLTSNGLKNLFNASRPPAVLDTETINIVGKAYETLSFPSGHTLTAFLMAGVCFAYTRNRYYQTMLILAACLAGMSRILLGVHWPIDVLAGGALGILCAVLAVIISFRWKAGLHPATHLFILFLLLINCFLVFEDKNDYHLAVPLILTTAFFALIITVRNYLWPSTYTLENLQARSALFSKLTQADILFAVVLVVLTSYRILVLFQPHLELFYDEAYYYHWSLNPDFGYYSKPPMVAWSILVSTTLFGTSVVAIKLMASLLYGATSIVIYYTIKHLAHKAAASLGGIIFLSIPLVGFNSEFITTDAPLFFFWSLSLLLFFHAIEKNVTGYWLALGVATGCGMLSKYTMGALPLGLFLYLLYSSKNRYLLLSMGPWLAAVTAGLIFSLNIYWNYTHNWIALQHTTEISQQSQSGSNILMQLGSLLGFLATQLIIFGPIWSAIGIKIIFTHIGKTKTDDMPVKHRQAQSETTRILLFSTFTLLFAISVQALSSRAFANWAGPWMIGATILLAMHAWSMSRKWLIRGVCAHLLLLSLFYHWPYVLKALDIKSTKSNDPYSRIYGWQELGSQLRPFLSLDRAEAPPILLSQSRDLLAYLGYYARPNSYHFARWNDNEQNIRDYYDLMSNLRNWKNDPNQDFIFVSKQELSASMLSCFTEKTYLTTLSVQASEDRKIRVYVYKMRGFLGYP